MLESQLQIQEESSLNISIGGGRNLEKPVPLILGSLENTKTVSEAQFERRSNYAKKLALKLAEQIPLNAEQLSQIKIIQVAPCGMFEGGNIKGIIESHANQSLSPEEKMLILFINGNQDAEDTVSEHIQKMKDKYPNLNVFGLTHRWEGEGVFSMGMIRHIPMLVTQNVFQYTDTNPVIVSNDVDCTRISPYYLENYVNKIDDSKYGSGGYIFERNSGNFLYDLNVILARINYLIQATNIKQIREILKYKYVSAQGGNTAFRLSHYGNNNIYSFGTEGSGEDVKFALGLKEKGVIPQHIFGNSFCSDPRRIKDNFNNGGFVHNSWVNWQGDGSAGRQNLEIEKKEFTTEEVLEYLNKYFCSRLELIYSFNNHSSLSDFVIRSNFYTQQSMKYLKIALQNQDVPKLPQIKIHSFVSNSTSSEELLEDLKNHIFITIAK